MNLVGKIMIVLILIMSMVFMAFSVAVYATHKSWMEMVMRPREKAAGGLPVGLRFQIADQKDENQKLQDKLTKLQEELARELSAKAQAIAKLEEARAAWTAEVTQLRADNAKLEEANKTQLASLTTTTTTLETLTKEVEGLRDEIRVAQDDRDQNFKKVITLTDQVQQTQGELKRLEERSVQLVTQVAAQKKVLNAYQLSEFTPTDRRPPPLHGKVVAVNQNDMVELSLGSDDGIKASHQVDVYRATNYLGRVEVLSTSTDRAVGKILASYKRGIIQKGDDVSTGFKSN